MSLYGWSNGTEPETDEADELRSKLADQTRELENIAERLRQMTQDARSQYLVGQAVADALLRKDV